MSRLFISHSSRNDDWAIALRDWLVREGWSDEHDIFLDLDPARGIAAGERWARALELAATRCEAVLFLVSDAWLASKWCWDEYQLAKELNKKLFALLIEDVALESLPTGLTAQWQVVRLNGEPSERVLTVHPRTQQPSPVYIAKSGLAGLKRGLAKAGIGAETFELQQDPNGPFGWRAPYRGLDALEPADAAVFFGRGADIARGIDMLRAVAARLPRRMLVILGASGAGKSSFVRAGLWPRLLRNDSEWLPLKPIRVGRGNAAGGGAIEGSEGLLTALEDAHGRFGLHSNRAQLRQRLKTASDFLALLRDLRQAAGRRALISQPPFPLVVLCLDQGEEAFAPDAPRDSEKFLRLARSAAEAGEAITLVTIRSDSYSLMQGAKALTGVEQVPLSLSPVPRGEISTIIRGPAAVLRTKAGPLAPVFDAAVIERLQAEVEDEADALPLLAFVMQRLMREHAGTATIGLGELNHTGGLAATIELAAEAAFADAGFRAEPTERRAALRRLFIPRLARVDRESREAQRRLARHAELPADLVPLARALTQHRLLVVKPGTETDGATVEVAHEAILRRWTTLAHVLDEDRDALLLLDGVLSAAADWRKANVNVADYLAHRGARLADARALSARGPDWARAIAPAEDYIVQCVFKEAQDRVEKEAVLERERVRLAEIQDAQRDIAVQQAERDRDQRRARRWLSALSAIVVLGLAAVLWLYFQNTHTQQELVARQTQIDESQVDLIAQIAMNELVAGSQDSALRLAVYAVNRRRQFSQKSSRASLAPWALANVVWNSDLRLKVRGQTAEFTPDGKRIVTIDGENVRISNVITGEELAVLPHSAAVVSAEVSSDGKFIVSASEKAARIWDIATGLLVAAYQHSNDISAATFSPDGRRIATISGTLVYVWDIGTRREMGFVTHNTPVTSIAFSPNSQRLLTASGNAARVWDATSRKQLAAFDSGNFIRVAAFSADGQRVFTAFDDSSARLWEVGTRKPPVTFAAFGEGAHLGESRAFELSPNGKLVLTAAYNTSAVRIWDAATGKPIKTLPIDGGVKFATFSHDSRRIVTTSHNNTAVWDATSGNRVATFQNDGSVESAGFSPGGQQIYTVGAGVRLWQIGAREPSAILLHNDRVREAAISLDGGRAATVSAGAHIWDVPREKLIAGPVDEGAPTFGPDGLHVLTISEKTVYIRETARWHWVAVLKHEEEVRSAHFSPDGLRILTISDRIASVWATTTGNLITALKHDGDLESGHFSPDGIRVLTVSDKTVRIWEAATGNLVTLLKQDEKVRSASFSPDGKRAIVLLDKAARLIEIAGGNLIATLERGVEMRSASFSSDGQRLLTVSESAVVIWDLALVKQNAVLPVASAKSATFDPGGERIVTASYSGLQIWDTTVGKLLATLEAQEMASASLSRDGKHVIATFMLYELDQDAAFVNSARIWNVRFATMRTDELLAEVCERRLKGATILSRDELRSAGYTGSHSVDACDPISFPLP